MRTLVILTIATFSVLGATRAAQAVPINFTTTGVFSNPTGGCTSASGSTITCGGYVLNFAGTNTVLDTPIGFNSTVNFGSVSPTGGSATEVVGGGQFALTITQTVPPPTGGSPFTYTASLFADLVLTSSGSYLQFSAPFLRLVTGVPYNVLYALTEADDGVLGKSDIAGALQSPLNINGTVRPTDNPAVPEPASLLLLGSGLVGLGARARKRFAGRFSANA